MRKWLQYLVSISVISLTIHACSSEDNARQEGSNVNNQAPVEGVTFRFIESNGLNMRIAEAGTSGQAWMRICSTSMGRPKPPSMPVFHIVDATT